METYFLYLFIFLLFIFKLRFYGKLILWERRDKKLIKNVNETCDVQ